MTENRPPIYLIGGAAGAGKTTVAAMLAKRLGISWLQADSTWLALKAASTMESHPELRFFPELQGSGIAFEAFDARFEQGSATVCAALDTVLKHELEGRREGLVLEGTWLTAGWMAGAPTRFSGADCRAIVLFESDPQAVLDALRSRSPGREPTPSALNVADWAWRIGLRLANEATAAGIAVVTSRPRDSLLERVVKAFGVHG